MLRHLILNPQCSVSGLSGMCGTRDAGGNGTLWLNAFALCGGWMRNPVSSATLFPDVPCKKPSYGQRGLIHVQMWLSAVENERRISEAFEVSCFSYASISSPAVDEMWKKIDHHPFDLLTILIML